MKLCRYCENKNCNYCGASHLSKHCNGGFKVDYTIYSDSRTKGVAKIDELTKDIIRLRIIRNLCSEMVITDAATYRWLAPIDSNLRGYKPDIAYIDEDLPFDIKERIAGYNCVFAAEINYF